MTWNKRHTKLKPSIKQTPTFLVYPDTLTVICLFRSLCCIRECATVSLFSVDIKYNAYFSLLFVVLMLSVWAQTDSTSKVKILCRRKTSAKIGEKWFH